MAKILISPLGVGGQYKNDNKFDRQYQVACYHLENNQYPSSRFVASVLYEHFNLDGIIFIGTVKSMWEEVYRFFCEIKQVEMDEDYWLELAGKIDSLHRDSPLDCLNLSKVKEILGERSECILIKYGLNQTELWENLDSIIKVVDKVQKGDELYIDLTHSFRSLSVFQFLTVTFINDLLSEKEIKIAGVYYGMLDVAREMGYAPIVDLNPLFEMTAWIKGAYTLKNYGNGELIAQLLKDQGSNELATQIEQLSEAININSVNGIKHKSSALKSSLRRITPQGPFSYLRNILENFVEKFSRSAAKESEFQLELAGWYFDNQRYATGYITLTEAIITYVCEIEGRNTKSQDDRDAMKNLLHKPENRNSQLAQLFFKVNPIRKSIAHALLDSGSKQKKVPNVSDAIECAKSYQEQAKKIFITKKLV